MQKSPWFFFSTMALSIFCAETFVMLLFLALPELPKLVEVFVDSTLLTVLISPSLYLFLYRPLFSQISENSLMIKKLRHSSACFKQQSQELKQSLQQLQAVPELLHAEKMSSLGRIVAGVAHEINNPVNFIHANLIYVSEYTLRVLSLLLLYEKHYPQPDPEIEALIAENELDFVIKDLPQILSSMEAGTQRIRKIVLSLRNFSRLDEAQVKAVNIHEGIESTLLILQHRLESVSDNTVTGIEIVKNYGNLPKVESSPGQMNQVFFYLINNAIDALREKVQISARITQETPTIWIRTFHDEDNHILIQIADNGCGMTEDVCHCIFQPFFTTKPVGQGIGLGLSISYKIVVEQHCGSIKCSSLKNQGTEFSIKLPIEQMSKRVTK